MVPLLGLLGYQLEYQAKAVELNGKTYAISHRVFNRGNTPLHIIGYREAAGLDRKPERTHIGAPRMSAHALVQEYLNLHDELYGLVTNGRMLRLLRDSSRLIKLTYLEFDLDRIFTDGLFADFAVLYRLLHATRLPVSHESAADSLIERYHQDSLDSGARIREGLSRAVEQAIRDFANGFLQHPHNDALRSQINTGKLTAEAYYSYLLHLIYRLLFLMVIEERGLVYPSNAQARHREIYQQYYSLQRLRRLAEKRHLADQRHHDLWLSLLATFKLFESDSTAPKLGLAPLAGDLFNPHAIDILGQSSLGNDVLLGCFKRLSLYQHPDNGQTLRVNYAALNVEEFGSVYEGLLEYQPVFVMASSDWSGEWWDGEWGAASGETICSPLANRYSLPPGLIAFWVIRRIWQPALSGTYGHSFCGYVRWEYAPTGLSDLVVYCVRRIFGLLCQTAAFHLLHGCDLNLKQLQKREHQRDLFFAKTVSIFEPLKLMPVNLRCQQHRVVSSAYRQDKIAVL